MEPSCDLCKSTDDIVQIESNNIYVKMVAMKKNYEEETEEENSDDECDIRKRLESSYQK